MATSRITPFICRNCSRRSTAFLRRSLATTATRSAGDPASELAELISPEKSSQPSLQPSSEPLPSRLPAEPSNSNYSALPSLSTDNRTRKPTNKTSKPKPNSRESSAGLFNAVNAALQARRPSASQSAQRAAAGRKRDIEAQATRIWREGDVYAPHDLSAAEQLKAKQARQTPRGANMRPLNSRKQGGKDVLDDLGIDPVKEYKNFALMSEFTTEMGRIRHGRDTGFRAVNQRKMAKAVRRAHGMGLLPSVHRHPEMMEERVKARGEYKHSLF